MTRFAATYTQNISKSLPECCGLSPFAQNNSKSLPKWRHWLHCMCESVVGRCTQIRTQCEEMPLVDATWVGESCVGGCNELSKKCYNRMMIRVFKAKWERSGWKIMNSSRETRWFFAKNLTLTPNFCVGRCKELSKSAITGWWFDYWS